MRGSAVAAAGLSTTSLHAGSHHSKKKKNHDQYIHKSGPLDGIGRENIKITNVRLRRFSTKIPSDKWWYGGGVTFLTEVETDQGITGIGGPSPYASWGGPDFVKNYTETHIREQLIGKNPFDVDVIAPSHREVTRAMCWAGANVACWDIIGKAKGKPVYELLAGDTKPETRILHYASAGTDYNFEERPEDLYDEALRYKEEGFYAFKFRFAVNFEENMTIAKYIPFLEKLREVVGPDFGLIQEFNMRLELPDVLELVPELKRLNFEFIEEPVNRWAGGNSRDNTATHEDIMRAIDHHKQIREAAYPVPVSGGETMVNKFEFKDWIEHDGYDIVPDCDTTGLSEAWYIARLAHLHNKPCVPHNWHGDLTWMSNIHLVAAIPNRLILESCRHYNPFRGGLFKEPIVVKNSYAEVPKGPGLGLEIIDDAEKKFPYDPNNHWLKDRPANT